MKGDLAHAFLITVESVVEKMRKKAEKDGVVVSHDCRHFVFLQKH